MSLDHAREALRALEAAVEPRPGEVRLELEGPNARLVLDNPTARGAVTLRMMGQLVDAVEALEAWDGALLTVEGGPVFCSGGHLGQVRRAVTDPEAAGAMAAAMAQVLDALLALPVVSVAVLDGPAIGGGAEIATATDFRVSGPAGGIHFVHAALGIAPGWGGAHRLALHVGPRRALEILGRAEPLDPAAALAVGLVDRVGPSGTEAADAFLEGWRTRPPEALRAVKAQIVAAREGDRAGEFHAFASVWGGPAHQAALARIPAARDT